MVTSLSLIVILAGIFMFFVIPFKVRLPSKPSLVTAVISNFPSGN